MQELLELRVVDLELAELRREGSADSLKPQERKLTCRWQVSYQRLGYSGLLFQI